MSDLTGALVRLHTGTQGWAGTDDHVYLGISGTDGGREFALATAGFDDFEHDDADGDADHYAEYGIGTYEFFGRDPETADAALNTLSISQPDITHVYLRKQGDRSHADDDAWRLWKAEVYLDAESDPTRLFESTGLATLGNEHGNQLWLGESDLSLDRISTRASSMRPSRSTESAT